jgi:hypothetical protein
MKAMSIAVLAGLMAASAASAQVFVSPTASAPWQGFMNVFNLPSAGGAFQFGSGWGVPDLNVSFNNPANQFTFSPNTIGDPNPYWYTPAGGPGAAGNKIMNAVLYVQDDSLVGQTVRFQGSILSNTLTSAHTGTVFIRDFAPDYSSVVETSIPVTVGNFDLALATNPAPGRHVQYGFSMTGVNVWSTDVAQFGSFVVSTAAIPGPASAALLAIGGLMATRRRRQA